MTFFIYLYIQERDKKFVSIKRYHCLYGFISLISLPNALSVSSLLTIGKALFNVNRAAHQR